MAIGLTVIILVILIVGIWIFLEAKRAKHKIFAVFLIVLILFTYISFVSVLKGKDLDLKTTSGWKLASQMYYAWLVNAFHNVKTITTFAFKQNWKNVTLANYSNSSTNSSSTVNSSLKVNLSSDIINKTVVKVSSNLSVWDKLK